MREPWAKGAGLVIRLDDALSWRLGRHALAPVDATSVSDVADRVVAMRAWPSDAADLAVATRLRDPSLDALNGALDSGEVIRSYAFRGGSYVFTADTAADLLAARTTTRIWETRRWQAQGGFEIDEWRPLRDAVCSMLEAGPMTRGEISAGLERIAALRHLAPAAMGSGADSLFKPLHWWGDICFGPPRNGESTFRLLGDVGDRSVIDVDEAGRRSVRDYLHAYGPATLDNLGYWLTEGLGVPRRRLVAWIAALGPEVTQVDLDGVDAMMLAEDVEAISTAHTADVVRLLPAFDPWVFGPGTADTRITPAERRGLASNGSNLVVSRGHVVGTWRLRKGTLSVARFGVSEDLPVDLLRLEAERLAAIRGEELVLEDVE